MISATRSEQGRQVDEDDIFIDLMSLLTCCLWSPAPERRERANAPGRGALPDSTPARTRPLNRNPEVPKAERKSGPPLMISATRSEQGRQVDEDDIFVDLTSLLTCCLWSPAQPGRHTDGLAVASLLLEGLRALRRLRAIEDFHFGLESLSKV